MAKAAATDRAATGCHPIRSTRLFRGETRHLLICRVPKPAGGDPEPPPPPRKSSGHWQIPHRVWWRTEQNHGGTQSAALAALVTLPPDLPFEGWYWICVTLVYMVWR